MPIHEDDIADVAAAALSGDAPTGRRVTLTGPAALTLREQVDEIAPSSAGTSRYGG